MRNRRVYYQLQQLHRVQRCNVYMTTVMVERVQPDISIEPPDYNTVLRGEEEDLPSYLQAVETGEI